MSRSANRLSRRLSWLLRHGAHDVGLDMDEAGWVDVAEVLAAIGISGDELREVVDTNDKGRLQLDGNRIRACQGHSADMPVTPVALEASWRTITPTHSLWHGTTLDALAGIGATGLVAGRRTHVHLAPGPDSHIGKRASIDVLVEISPTRLAAHGITIFEAPNGVILVRHAPVGSIVALHARTTDAHAAIETARAAPSPPGFSSRRE